jgi:hypothetical protein
MPFPTHRSTTHLQVVDEWNGLQLWRVATNTLTKQPRTAEERLSSNLGLSVGQTTPRRKKELCYESFPPAKEEEIYSVELLLNIEVIRYIFSLIRPNGLFQIYRV